MPWFLYAVPFCQWLDNMREEYGRRCYEASEKVRLAKEAVAAVAKLHLDLGVLLSGPR